MRLLSFSLWLLLGLKLRIRIIGRVAMVGISSEQGVGKALKN